MTERACSSSFTDSTEVVLPGLRDGPSDGVMPGYLHKIPAELSTAPQAELGIVERAPFVGAVDVHYDNLGGARAALVVCGDLTFSSVESEHVADIAQAEPYESGALFKRELPCIRAVLDLGPRLDLLVIDGYATLDPQGRRGLGAHAADAIGVPVIGVAKTPFRTATHAAEVIRGVATRPLYVTAAGLEVAEAARIVSAMAGPNRIPDALARVDRLARGRVQPIVN